MLKGIVLSAVVSVLGIDAGVEQRIQGGGIKRWPDAGTVQPKPRIDVQQVTVCTIHWPDGGVQQDASFLCEVLRQAL